MEYPTLRPGDKVILGEHEVVNGTKNWGSSMNQYIGKEATIVRLSLSGDGSKMPLYYVDIDSQSHIWRVANMTILSSDAKPVITIRKLQYGVACSRCQTFCPDAEVVDNFKCYGCSHP